MRSSYPTIILVLSISFSISCDNRSEIRSEGEVARLRKDVSRLASDNRKLAEEVSALRQQIETQTQTQRSPQSAEVPAAPSQQMTVDSMKSEIQPLLQNVLEKMKKRAETPRGGQQFGMRVEYKMKSAVYGLMRNDDPSVPYHAKVIVPYEKFVESDESSKSYGNGSATIVFAYTDNHWQLQSYQ